MSKSGFKPEKGKMKFRPKARLLHLLGHELITDESIALMELTKNSYDADAREVEVTLFDVVDKASGKIEIRDDGHGMTLEIIKTAWMEPARDNKTGADGKRRRTKRFNRLPLGEKGVGRFSADKLGFKLEITSRYCRFDPKTKEADYLSLEEVVVTIEGRDFQKDTYLDEIECEWRTREPLEFEGDKHGTLLRISDLRVNWSYDLAKKARDALSRLSPPFAQAKDFEVLFESNNFPDLSSKIENPLLKIAPFSLDATIDEYGIMKYTVIGPDKKPTKGRKDLRIGQESFYVGIKPNQIYREPVCGPFKFKLFAFEKERAKAKKYGMDKPKMELLSFLSGVSIYRDDFRILPYGEHGNDWLQFDKRRVQNPGEILGNDRVIGFVEISQSLNPQLKDKTNREGLIEEGNAFEDLKKLTEVAADFLGIFRYNSEPHEKRSLFKIQESKNAVVAAYRLIDESSMRIATILGNARKCIEENKLEEAKNILAIASSEVEKNANAVKEMGEGSKTLIAELNFSSEQIASLVSLSGIGMTAERMTHEFSKAVRNSMTSLQKSLSKLNLSKNQDPEINRDISRAIANLEIARDTVKQMEPLYYSQRKIVETLNVAKVVKDMEVLYTNTIQDLGLEVKVIGDSDLEVEMSKGHLMQVFDNLFDNAFFWLKYNPSKDPPKIWIKISCDDKTVIFADNGPGIDKHIESHLFEPFVSTKPNGRGLGLFIVQDILQNYKAEIDVLGDGVILSGANFRIRFSED